MRLITAKTLEEFAERHSECRQAIENWRAVVEASVWPDAAAVRRTLGASARPIGTNRVVFKINGNAFRLIAEVRYADPARGFAGIVYVQFIGTHAEYDRIDALTVTRTSMRRSL